MRTQVYLEPKKLKAKFGYADKLSVPFAVVLGSDEAEKQAVSLKDLTTGSQTVVSADAAARLILEKTQTAAKPVKEIKQ